MTVFEAARRHMVESQLLPNKVTDDRVLDAFARVSRELFVPEMLRPVAYVDEDLPLGRGRFLMEPMVAARLIQAAAPARADTALVVGAGTSYEVVVLSQLTRSVVALEEIRARASGPGRTRRREHCRRQRRRGTARRRVETAGPL